MLYKIEKDDDGNHKKPILITSQEEIERYLAGDYDESEEYYYITTEKPDNKAIDSLLDRTFGKAQQSVDLTSDGDRIDNINVNIVYGPQSAIDNSICEESEEQKEDSSE